VSNYLKQPHLPCPPGNQILFRRPPIWPEQESMLTGTQPAAQQADSSSLSSAQDDDIEEYSSDTAM
jgi:hypothetical protein